MSLIFAILLQLKPSKQHDLKQLDMASFLGRLFGAKSTSFSDQISLEGELPPPGKGSEPGSLLDISDCTDGDSWSPEELVMAGYIALLLACIMQVRTTAHDHGKINGEEGVGGEG